MKLKIVMLFLCLTTIYVPLCFGQNNVTFQLVNKDFGIWAYKQHNEICQVILDNFKSGKLSSYNVKNVKESSRESISKLAVKKTVFIQTDRRDPSVGKDSVIMDEASENYYFFKTSNDYLLLKPFKSNNNLLKLNKSELFAILNESQKEYFLNYTSNYILCLDSIPVLSERLFNHFNSQLFEYSKLPSTKLFMNDSINRFWTNQEKESMSQDQLFVFLATDPDDPTIGVDTVILFEYNINDTNKQQTIIFMCDFKNNSLKINTISCGLERKLMGYRIYIQPFGYLPYNETLPFSATEKQMLKDIIELKMIDGLNQHKNNEDIYNDFYGINY